MSGPFSPGFLQRLPAPPAKVALLRASRIGDFICASPALRALRASLPQAEISMITLPLLRDLALRSPFIDRFIPFPGYPGLAEQLFDARQTAAFFQKMQAEHFDLAIQMQGSGVYSNPFTLMLGARHTAGFVRPGDPAGRLDAALPLPAEGHEIQRVLALTTFLGAPAVGDRVDYSLWPQDYQAAHKLLQDAQPPLIGLNPGARDATRRWPVERFATAGNILQQETGGTITLLGDSQEENLVSPVLKQIKAPLVNLTGKTTLGTLGAVIKRLSVLITNDTGPAHIAYALGTPVVTLFGGGDHRQYGPLQKGPYKPLVYEVPCRPCSYAECPIGKVCLTQLSVKQVIQAALHLLNDGQPVDHKAKMG